MGAAQPPIYGSPLGLQWAVPFKLSPAALVEELLHRLASNLNPDQPFNLHADVQVWADGSGWLYWTFSPTCLAAWLDQLLHFPPRLLNHPSTSIAAKPAPAEDPSTSILTGIPFAVQYAHARCCSLLRLADRHQLLQLTDPNPLTSPPLWSILTPDPFPWLTCNGQLPLLHPAEWDLLTHVLEFPSELRSQRSQWPTHAWKGEPTDLGISVTQLRTDQLWRQAQGWSERFEDFYRHCRIFAELSPELAQVRLGLLILTHALLHFYLRDLLGVAAPLEL